MKPALMISCRQASQLVEQDLERPLNLLERFQLRLHLTLCGMCRAYRRQVRRLRAFFRGEEWLEQLPPLPDEARDRIRARLQQQLES